MVVNEPPHVPDSVVILQLDDERLPPAVRFHPQCGDVLGCCHTAPHPLNHWWHNNTHSHIHTHVLEMGTSVPGVCTMTTSGLSSEGVDCSIPATEARISTTFPPVITLLGSACHHTEEHPHTLIRSSI